MNSNIGIQSKQLQLQSKISLRGKSNGICILYVRKGSK